MGTIQNSIIKTLCYADVFNYPLTLSELSKYFISSKPISQKKIANEMRLLPQIKKRGKYFFLSKRDEIVKTRNKRERISRAKIKAAQKITRILGFIPTIQFIGLSGSLAMKNAKEGDDIDLFIITSARTLWISRFFIILLLFFLGKKRSPGAKHSQDKICTNMFVTTDMLLLPHNKRNLFTAHEIAQVKPLVNKRNTYETFLSENGWISKYMANVFIPSHQLSHARSSGMAAALDSLFFKIQQFYMRRRIKSEVVTKDSAMFHPCDYKEIVLKAYESRYKTLIKKSKKQANYLEMSHFVLSSKTPKFSLVITPGS